MVPAEQSVHAVEFIREVLNVPATQAVTATPEPVNPTSALQSSCASEAAGELELTGQSPQVSDDWAAVSLNLPASQSVQVSLV
jgi:hypothetical protein